MNTNKSIWRWLSRQGRPIVVLQLRSANKQRSRFSRNWWSYFTWRREVVDLFQ